MKVALFAMLLSVMQAAPPVRGQTADSTNQSSQKAEKHTAQHKQSIAPTPRPEQVVEKATSKEAPASNTASPSTEQTVRVRELPSVSVSRDWADWTLWAASGLLAVVGLIGIGLAYRTLKAIRRQGLSMRRQTTHLRNSVIQAGRAADAARDTAAAVIAIERAWIIAEEAYLVQGQKGWFIRPTIKNSGRSIARVRRISLGEI